MAAAILGGHYAGRPISVRSALARSRIRLLAGRRRVADRRDPRLCRAVRDQRRARGGCSAQETDVSIVASTLAAALVGSPLAYLLDGRRPRRRRPVRGDRAARSASSGRASWRPPSSPSSRPWPSCCLVRSRRRARHRAPGVRRARSRPESGPAGLALVTIGVVAGVFALGTLIYTALAISIAPQVVMFVGPDPRDVRSRPRAAGRRPRSRPCAAAGRDTFRWLTIPLLIGARPRGRLVPGRVHRAASPS